MRLRRAISKYKEDIIGNSIYDILKFCFMCLFSMIISSGLLHNMAKFFSDYPLLLCGCTFLGLIISFAIFVIIYKKLRRYKLRIKKMVVHFEYEQEQIIVTSEITVKALRPNLSDIYNRYTWFPDEHSQVKCLTRGFTIKKLPKKDTSYEYKVDFNRVLKKGEEVTYKVRVINNNKHGHFKDFYSREIIVPIDNLIINISVPSRYGFSKIKRSIILGSAYSDQSETETFDFNNTHIWEIDTPMLGYEYKLEWKK